MLSTLDDVIDAIVHDEIYAQNHTQVKYVGDPEGPDHLSIRLDGVFHVTELAVLIHTMRREVSPDANA